MSNISDYQQEISIHANAEEVFKALTERLPEWWSKSFEGAAKKTQDEFTIRFGPTFKTMRIIEIIPNKKVTWLCIDQHLEMPPGLPELSNKREWVGNKITWGLQEKGNTILLQLLHEGLHPGVECWGVCEQGWDQSLQSIVKLLEDGAGFPFQQLDSTHLANAIENQSFKSKKGGG